MRRSDECHFVPQVRDVFIAFLDGGETDNCLGKVKISVAPSGHSQILTETKPSSNRPALSRLEEFAW